MSRIVTTHYRHKRPSPKRKPAALEVPAIVWKRGRANVVGLSDRVEDGDPKPAIVTPGKGRAGNDNRAETDPKSPGARTTPSRIVTVRRRGKRFADVPDMTPEEHQRRGDAAAALWRELVRRAAGDE